MPQRARGIQQIQPSLADYQAFPKGGDGRKSFEFVIKRFEFGERGASSSKQISGLGVPFSAFFAP
jgi:hypothetical protein